MLPTFAVYTMKRKLISWSLALIVLGFIVFELVKPADLPKGFQRVAFVRNENNKGTIELFYAFAVADPSTANYEQAGNSLPYNKHSGITTAFFFDEKAAVPRDLQLQSPHFDTVKYKPVAIYTRQKDGTVSVTKPE